MKTCIISVEGIIGAGKTTFVNFMKDKLNAIICDEPVAKWRETGILNHFTSDMKRWAFTFQIQVINDRIQNLKDCIEKLPSPNNQIIIIDRSIYTDKCFVEVLKENGKINEIEYNVYQELWNNLEKTIGRNVKPDLFIYLRPTIEESMKRIKQRGRSEELSITSEYQEKLQIHHDKLFSVSDGVIVIDNTKPEDDIRINKQLYNSVSEKIKKLNVMVKTTPI